MVRPGISKKLKKIKKNLLAMGLPIEKMILFGSHAKDFPGPRHDLDLCFLFDSSEKKVSEFRSEISIYLNCKLRIDADVLAYPIKHFAKNRLSPIIHEIKSHGVAI